MISSLALPAPAIPVLSLVPGRCCALHFEHCNFSGSHLVPSSCPLPGTGAEEQSPFAHILNPLQNSISSESQILRGCVGNSQQVPSPG